jgi:hypothetical protein
MKRTLGRLTLSLLLVATPSLLFAYPLKVRPARGEGQTVVMCPDCNQPIACARAGDYTIALSGDVDPPNLGGNARFMVRLTDREGKAVTNAKVALVLSMPGHEHPPRTLAMKAEKGGRYAAATSFKTVRMEGPWRAEVRVTTPRGDTVVQPFTFTR